MLTTILRTEEARRTKNILMLNNSFVCFSVSAYVVRYLSYLGILLTIKLNPVVVVASEMLKIKKDFFYN